MPLKRFLTLHGEDFSKKYPSTFETFCLILVSISNRRLDNQVSKKLLIELVGQPSLITPAAFTREFLSYDDAYRANFIKYGWREAIEEGLKANYPGWGQRIVEGDGETTSYSVFWRVPNQ